MLSATTLTVLPYERRFRSQVIDLVSSTYRRHNQFDWYSFDEWLDSGVGITQLAWRNGHLAGVMSASQPLNATAWIRAICLSETAKEAEVIATLWQSMRLILRDKGVVSCWLAALEPWVEAHTAQMGMTRSEMLISMRRESGLALPPAPEVNITLEVGSLDSIAALTAIDHAAFVPPFQLSHPDIRRAYRISTTCTVAKVGDETVGFQISSRHGKVGHLARLAVLPAYQGRGIGAALVREMIAAFLRRQVEVMTVNTQLSNTRSQVLYHAYGFERNRYDTPMFSVSLV